MKNLKIDKVTARPREFSLIILISAVLTVVVVGSLSVYLSNKVIAELPEAQKLTYLSQIAESQLDDTKTESQINQQIIRSLVPLSARNVSSSEKYYLAVLRSIGDNLPKLLIIDLDQTQILDAKNIRSANMVPALFAVSTDERYIAFTLDSIGSGCANPAECAASRQQIFETTDDWGVWVYDTVESKFEQLGALWNPTPGQQFGEASHAVSWNEGKLDFYLYSLDRVGPVKTYDPVSGQVTERP